MDNNGHLLLQNRYFGYCRAQQEYMVLVSEPVINHSIFSFNYYIFR